MKDLSQCKICQEWRQQTLTNCFKCDSPSYETQIFAWIYFLNNFPVFNPGTISEQGEWHGQPQRFTGISNNIQFIISEGLQNKFQRPNWYFCKVHVSRSSSKSNVHFSMQAPLMLRKSNWDYVALIRGGSMDTVPKRQLVSCKENHESC